MKTNNRKNEVSLSGYVSWVGIKLSQYGYYGAVVIAIDDGYRDVKNNNAWVDRTQFIKLEISEKKDPQLSVGDFLDVSAKLTFEQGTGENQYSGIKVRVNKINIHFTKEELAFLKQSGHAGHPQQQQSRSQPQQPQPRGDYPPHESQQNGYPTQPQPQAPHGGKMNGRSTQQPQQQPYGGRRS
ncbi:hypothetical protein [Aeromonas sp. Y311-2]|uniref:hypothetical protein n=1 Tax=Aeromonas sp. Y311-2 TaxID=2990507 RepID=UPI0022E523BD|nr:hypothetical protein [Aeromonas sp. Y311-2]